MSSSTWRKVEPVVVCTRLAGNHRAGMLLYVIARRMTYAKATLPGKEGKWSANSREEWRRAADLSMSQVDRILANLDENGLIRREHGRWAGKPHMLHVQLTERTRIVLGAATTFLALDTLVGGGTSDELEIKRLRKLWAAWPGTILDEAPKKAGGIALWYEQCDDRQYFKVNVKLYALCYLTEILKAAPEIVKMDIGDGGPEYLAANLHGTIEHKMGQTELWADGLA